MPVIGTLAVENKKVATSVAKEIRRPRKQVRERLITHDEYLGVYARAVPSVKLAMVMCVRTLGLPGDEIYLKGMLTEIVRPNEVPILALVKK